MYKVINYYDVPSKSESSRKFGAFYNHLKLINRSNLVADKLVASDIKLSPLAQEVLSGALDIMLNNESMRYKSIVSSPPPHSTA